MKDILEVLPQSICKTLWRVLLLMNCLVTARKMRTAPLQLLDKQTSQIDKLFDPLSISTEHTLNPTENKRD
jgi:hypothetical protein